MFGNITPGATVKKTLQMKFSVAASLRTGWKSFASEMLPCTGPSILLWLAPAFRPGPGVPAAVVIRDTRRGNRARLFYELSLTIDGSRGRR